MESRVVKLKSSDGGIYKVDEVVAYEALVLKDVIEMTGASDTIPLFNVTSKTLEKVIEYCEYHAKNEKKEVISTDLAVASTSSTTSTSSSRSYASADAIKAFDSNFVKGTDAEMLFNLMLAANYLNIPGLLNLGCKAVADTMKGKTPQEIRLIFNIENDFTNKEEEDIQQTNKWASN